MKKEMWNIGTMVGLVILTLLVSPVGIIVGSMNLKYEESNHLIGAGYCCPCFNGFPFFWTPSLIIS